MQKRIWSQAQEQYIRQRLERDRIKLHVLSQELHIDYSTLRTKVKQMNIDYLHQDEVTELKQEAVYQRIDNALPPGHPLTWDLICPGIEFPDPYTRSGKN